MALMMNILILQDSYYINFENANSNTKYIFYILHIYNFHLKVKINLKILKIS